VFKVNSNEKLGFGEVKKGVENGCFKLMGQLNMARAGLRVMDEWENNKGVIKVSNKYLDEVHAGLLFIQGINGKKAGVESVYVSGGMKCMPACCSFRESMAKKLEWRVFMLAGY